MTTDFIPQIADRYPVEPLPKGWITAQVRFRHQDGREETRIEIIDLKTEKRYLHEPLRMIAFKCVLLSLASPLYSTIYLAWHLLRIPFCTAETLLTGMGHFFDF